MRVILLLIAGLVFASAARAEVEHCAGCGIELLNGTIYVVTDKVTNEKKQLCPACSKSVEVCFQCGLPVKTNQTTLTDGRLLCERDAKNAMLDPDEAKKVCDDVKDSLDRLLSRFMTLPGTNVETAVVDRVNILQLFKVPGNDFQCPMVLGYIQSKPRQGRFHHDMSLLSALPKSQFKAVCAHEFTHAWQAENISAQRMRTLGHDASEGFCELIAWLLMDSLHEETEMATIRRNNYTRGQVDLFIDAYNRYGLNEVIDWMKYGVDAVLNKDDVNNVRHIEIPSVSQDSHTKDTSAEYSSLPPATTSSGPDTLILRGITWTKDHPLALINDHTFGTQERGRVHVGTTNVFIRCLEISTNWAVVQVDGSPANQTLFLNEN